MRSRSRASMNRIRQFAEEFIMQNRRSPSCNEIAEAEDYGLPGSTCPDFGKHDSV